MQDFQLDDKVECMEKVISVGAKNSRCPVFLGRTDNVEAMAVPRKI